MSDENIGPLISFVEEINHALHAGLQFQRGGLPSQDEAYARNLELQASVDTYLVLLLFVAFFRKPGRVTRADRRWLRFHMFHGQQERRYRDPAIRARYLETTLLAKRYTTFLEGLATSRRVDEIRIFHALDYSAKREHILALHRTGSRNRRIHLRNHSIQKQNAVSAWGEDGALEDCDVLRDYSAAS